MMYFAVPSLLDIIKFAIVNAVEYVIIEIKNFAYNVYQCCVY